MCQEKLGHASPGCPGPPKTYWRDAKPLSEQTKLALHPDARPQKQRPLLSIHQRQHIPTMAPKEVKVRSGLALGLNKGHVRLPSLSSPSPGCIRAVRSFVDILEPDTQQPTTHYRPWESASKAILHLDLGPEGQTQFCLMRTRASGQVVCGGGNFLMRCRGITRLRTSRKQILGKNTG